VADYPLILWFLRFTALVAAGFLIGLVWLSVRRRMVRRTTRNWRGGGRREDLPPEQVALLIGAHPATALAIFLRGLAAAGRVVIAPGRPLRIVPAGEGGRGPAEEALLHGLDGGGGLTTAAALAAIGMLWRDLDSGMAGRSGPATVAYYRALVDEMWREAETRSDLPAGAETWMALTDPTAVWDRMGAGAGWERLRDLFRDAEALRNEVLSTGVLSEAAARAEEGWLAWRKDLVVVETPGTRQYP
jgi:hypothetical protein